MCAFRSCKVFKWIPFFAIVVLLIQGCFGVRPAATKSGRSLYQTFYVGEAGNQYFIKPMVFESEGDQYLTMDITFRYNNTFNDTATVNISFYSDKLIKEVQSVSIKNTSTEILLSDYQRLYIEKQGKMIVSRFSCNAHMPSLALLFEDSRWIITMQDKESHENYLPSRRTAKKLESLYQDLFFIL
ncbi:MAG: hypothetical protein K9J30_10775 [Bacteroidales bacterium]|nr:hypothetical protein [Bacteroidales bacterium]